MLDFLIISLRYGISMCVTGATSSGKTTLMSWLLSTIPDDKRIFTIENGTREFDLVKIDEEGNVINNVIHTVTRYSEEKRQNIDQEKLLESALTANPDYICVFLFVIGVMIAISMNNFFLVSVLGIGFSPMTILLIGNIPLMYFLNKSWYQTLMFTSIGKGILAVCITVIFISLANKVSMMYQ